MRSPPVSTGSTSVRRAWPRVPTTTRYSKGTGCSAKASWSSLNRRRVFSLGDPAVIASRTGARFPFSDDHIFNTRRRAIDRPLLKTSTT